MIAATGGRVHGPRGGAARPNGLLALAYADPELGSEPMLRPLPYALPLYGEDATRGDHPDRR